MCKQMLYLICSVLVLGVAGSASAGLVAHWALDDGTGTTASDSSGNGYDATIGGTPQWVTGQVDGALDLDGETNYINMDNRIVEGTFTLAMWLRIRNLPYASGYYAILHDDQWDSGSVHVHLRANTSLFNIDINGGPNTTSTTVFQEDQWYHVVFTITTKSGSAATELYVDGVLESTATGGSIPYLGPLNFGAWDNGGSGSYERYVPGVFDDIRVYDRVLSEGQAVDLFNGIEPTFLKAIEPSPADGAQGVDTPLLQWAPGDGAVAHNVYFGTDPDNLAFIGPQGWTVYWHAAGLNPGTTYYWRIDEVQSDGSVVTGDVWSFTATPLTAWNPSPA
ncbi:MAG: hypothetical protein JSU70_18850, partial [Phycisphaerales bacterium]